MVDTIAVIEDALIERMRMDNADRSFLLLEQGRKTEASIISTHSGGGAINSAVAFSRLGYSVKTLAKLGSDSRADVIRNTLNTEGISKENICITNAAGTGASVLISAHERNAAVFTFRGANSFLKSSDLSGVDFSTSITYISGLSDGSADLFGEIVSKAAAAGSFIVANPGIRQLAARGVQLEKSLSKIDILSMNRDEAAVLVPRLVALTQSLNWATPTPSKIGHMDLLQKGFSSFGFEMPLESYCDAILQLGTKCLLITDGKYGAYAVTASQLCFCPSEISSVVGTAGAGGAFTSTFAARYFEGASALEALQCATMNASSVISYADTQTGLLQRSELCKRQNAFGHKLAAISFAAIQLANGGS